MELTTNHKMTSSTTHPLQYRNARIALCAGGTSAVLASICCIGPFLLVTLGFSSAKILYLLTLADWSRPFFVLLALAALLFSYSSIWSSTSVLTAKGVCMSQKEIMIYKCYFLFVVSLVVTVLMLPYFAPNIG
jgi:mercuric ion transport protein